MRKVKERQIRLNEDLCQKLEKILRKKYYSPGMKFKPLMNDYLWRRVKAESDSSPIENEVGQ